MNAITRTLRFSLFTLTEYVRSGRVLIELLASVVVLYLFFVRRGPGMQPNEFFTTAGLLMVILTFYTTTAIMGMGDRAQGYLIVSRRIGRGGYLLGLYGAALFVEFAAYGIISLGTAFLNPVANLSIEGWLLGTLPLMLNTALLSALMALLSPIVLSSGWRLAILAVVAVAFSGNLIGGQTLSNLWPSVATALNVLRTIFSTPLLPAFTGFSLSVDQDYSGFRIVIPFAQFSLTLSLLSLALYSFTRRELVFSENS